MTKKATKTFKAALRSIRKDQGVSLQELGLRIESDASHVSKLEGGKDVTLSTVLRLAEALDVEVTFGGYALALDSAMKKRTRKRS